MGICIVQNGGVVSVCCHTADSEENERFERANVFIGAPKWIYVKVFFQRCFRVKKLCLGFRPLNELGNGFIIEVDGEQVNTRASVMVPLRTLAEKLGFTVSWDDGVVTVTGQERYVQLTVAA